MKNTNEITVNGQQIDLNIYLTTLKKQEHSSVPVAIVEVSEYAELGYFISALINVSRVAIENETLDVDKLEVSRVLELATYLVPHSEFELLDRLK